MNFHYYPLLNSLLSGIFSVFICTTGLNDFNPIAAYCIEFESKFKN